ncbi:N-methylhydantoinase [Marivita cryptomonadis]|jgi:N-methylhydantoinase A|uniref:hydantoinase/oxoprolinase family protein n=1 Tax=Marivita cryptomonadis TaxID=505252 RepID=UPI000A1DA626|nr:hydantoinase/oxoprolinase family protein [Marivita cryptomonadis]OSQ54490.1 N-methylhydantoinase [Marivita cryptomonadis]
MKTIGVDVGGTFTDLIYLDPETGEMGIHKVSTTPDDPSQGVMTGLKALMEQSGIDPAQVTQLLHGTTTATNAVLEAKGARAGMITNDGFRDVLHIGRHQRPNHYSIMQEIPWQDRPLIQRRYRKTVPGRLVPPTGEELIPLDEDAIRAAAQELKDDGVDAVAICFLFSYLNPDHEQRAKAIVSEVMPDAFVTTSSSISPQFREFERFTTAALATFVGPKVGRYVANLERALNDVGVTGDFRIMASNGGVATPRMVTENPALTMMSGLAAGVLGGVWVGGKCGRNKVITFDIGGTSADIGIAVDGVCAETDARSTSIAGFPLLMPMLDIHTIGAGGGSIAYVDQGGAFRVGPQSAGADPGPAAYGRGGTQPTVTDANLVLGRLEPGDFLGGDMGLDLEASQKVIGTLAAELGLDPLEAAEGVLTILNANMANAIRSRTVQRGIDPREFSLVAMGGAGPLQGAEVAQVLELPEVIVPPHPGITSALGLLVADLKYDVIRTQFQVSETADLARFNSEFDTMEADLKARLAEDHVFAEDVTFERAGDLRYLGQGYELRVPFDAGDISEASLQAVWDRFHALHASEYGHAFRDSPIEVVNLRLTARGHTKPFDLPVYTGGGSLEDAHVLTRDAVFRKDGSLETFATVVYRRDLLPLGVPLPGPAILLQKDSTTVVPPGATAKVDKTGSVIITLEAKP